MTWKIVHIGLLLVLQSTYADTHTVVGTTARGSGLKESVAFTQPDERRPDFRSINNSQHKKEAFFKYLLPQVRAANQAIYIERQLLLGFLDQVNRLGHLDSQQQRQLKNIARKYRHALPSTADPADLAWPALLARVDAIPASLVLAQAANESAWGTSRFAVDANNFFGIWCYSPGCGLKPSQRNQSATHEVKRYTSVSDGVSSYMLNLNRHRAYALLRQLRQDQRDLRDPPKGSQLAEGLLAYSSRGIDYVRDIQRMIHANNLENFTRPRSV